MPVTFFTELEKVLSIQYYYTWVYMGKTITNKLNHRYTDRNAELKTTVFFQNHPNSFRDYHFHDNTANLTISK